MARLGFMPMGDASVHAPGLMAMAIGNGSVIVDDGARSACGDPKPHIGRGMLDKEESDLSILLQLRGRPGGASLAHLRRTIG